MYLNLVVTVLDLNNMKLRGEIRRCYYDDATNTPMYKIFIGSKFVIVLSYSNLLKLKEGTLNENYVQLDFKFDDKYKKDVNTYVVSIIDNLTCMKKNKVLTSQTLGSSHSSTRTVKGTSNLYYIENNCLKCCEISASRCSKKWFETQYPKASFAFCGNPNVSNAPTNGSGLLTILHINNSSYLLGILVDGDTNGGLYLLWTGYLEGLMMDSFSDSNNSLISKTWNCKYIKYNETQGTHISQVYGQKIQLNISNYSSNYKEEYFIMSPLGPDIMKVPTRTTLDMLMMKCKLNEEYIVVYCIDNAVERKTKHKTNHLSICCGKGQMLVDDFSTKLFADIDIELLRKIKTNFNEEQFTEYILQHCTGQCYQRLIAPRGKATRIKLVTETEFNNLIAHCKEIKFDNHHFLVGKETGRLEKADNLGVLVSTIGYDSTIISLTKDITFDTIELFHTVYGKGSYRERCTHLGLATYRGPRNSNRPHPNVFVHENEITDHQYFNAKENTFSFGQVFTEQIINSLGESAMSFGRKEYPNLFDIIDNSCTKPILTCGSPRKFRRDHSLIEKRDEFMKLYDNSNNNHLSFASTNHLDDCDNLNKGITSEYFINKCITKYDKRMLETIGASMPTTCQYHHVWKKKSYSKEYDVSCYFIYDGLGIAQPLVNTCSIMFMASSFSHSTSFCYLKRKHDNSIITRNDPDTFTLLAWGKSGGPKDMENNIQLRRNTRRRCRND
jgi:hypothetical protein